MTMDSSRRITDASYLLAAAALLIALPLHLLPALIAGLIAYTLVGAIASWLEKRLPRLASRELVVAFLGVVVVALLAGLIVAGVAFVRSELAGPDALPDRIMPVIDQARAQLPPSIVAHLPVSSDDLRAMATSIAKRHSEQIQLAGKATLLVLGRILIGLVVGMMVALAHERGPTRGGPLLVALTDRCGNLARAFRDIVFAQGKIAAINTAFTAIFLLVAMPLAGFHLPLAKTLVVVTFVVGFLPVVGNLISNSLIVVSALSVSLGAAIIALVFLVLLHKLEYFLNARIVGGQIRAKAWELLLAMLVLEAAFGMAGVVAAPIYYAWLKTELKAEGLI
ncbi:MAG: AI-2E family transporter [Proteobacteria bacterium]|nr:AI-2E family transporter [Pseudomonadota bacterium]